MTAADFANLIKNAKRSGAGYVGCCPAHDDDRASLSWRDGDKGGVVVKCFTNC